MLNLVIFGPPGSGKGTQSARIVEKYELIHLSTGDIFREEIANETPVGVIAKSFIDRGCLVPDELVLKELYRRAYQHLDAKGLVFDGFPRTLVQAEMLDKLLVKKGIPISLVLSVDVDKDELNKRIMGRALESGRSDDNEQVIQKRLEVYTQQTMPLIEFYKAQGKLASISGMAPVDEVFNRICKAIETFQKSGEIIKEVF
jgi:adenylate kinase